MILQLWGIGAGEETGLKTEISVQRQIIENMTLKSYLRMKVHLPRIRKSGEMQQTGCKTDDIDAEVQYILGLLLVPKTKFYRRAENYCSLLFGQ